MTRFAVCAGAGALLWLALGCAATNEPSPKVVLQRVAQERDGLRRDLADEQAKSATLQKQLDDMEKEWTADRAKLSAQSEQLSRLVKSNQELSQLLESRATRPLERPAVSGSPLPTVIDEALQALTQKLGERVWYDRGRGALSFANDRLFEAGSDVVRAERETGLLEVAGILNKPELAEFEAIVVGHTDATPITKPETVAKHPTNWHLSVHRAIAVKDVLVKAGVPADRVGVMGYADQRPVSGDPARNRRVEIFIVRKGGIQPFEAVSPAGRGR